MSKEVNIRGARSLAGASVRLQDADVKMYGRMIEKEKLEDPRKFKPRPQRIGTQMPTIEFIVETKRRLSEMPVGGDLNLTVKIYELTENVGSETVYTDAFDVPTGDWDEDLDVLDDTHDGEHTHEIIGDTGAGTEHTHDVPAHAHDLVEHVHIEYGNAITSAGYTDPAGSPLPSVPFDTTEDSESFSVAGESAHTHPIDFTSDDGISTPGVHHHNVHIPPIAVTVPVVTYSWTFLEEFILVWRDGLFKDQYNTDDNTIPPGSADMKEITINTFAP